MSDYTDLKKKAEAATPGPWVADNSRHEGSVNASDRHIGMVSMYAEKREDIQQNFANQEFIAAANPAAVLDLIAEIGRLKQENRLLTKHNEFLASSDSRLAHELRAVKDALGLDFTANVSGEVVPLIERLRKLPTCWTEVLEQSEANDQLLDQVLELSADADRWRFVRNAIPNQSPIAVWHEGTKPLLGKMADDAVDAARTMAR